ncbi:tumor necrosis factor receptor superfamily member 9a isoform X1 [Alosa pseudoharengus]|uniref:tumor necrosis factor receptor superfamily member 9a isoform X1 n=1 Tax=Alosa pseudoharengus TaxID=34774 RepID=UPI003F8C2E05
MAPWTLFTALLMLSILFFARGDEIGCKKWDDAHNGQIFCLECHTGNRLVVEKGFDPTKLCTPCKNGTYTKTNREYYCDRCNQCVDPQVERTPCHGTTNTVCGCKKGYRCYRPDCSICERECPPGTQPSIGKCPSCPKGTFNDKIHDKCKEWTKLRCPPGYTVTNGTTTTDSKCDISNEIMTTKQRRSTTTPPDEKDWNMALVWIPLGVLFSLVTFIVVVFGLFITQIKINKVPTKTPIKEQPITPDPFSLMLVEQEECSFRQPQQEQGSSMESLSTQDSMEKLLPPV